MSFNNQHRGKIIVIGAGIAGLNSAFYLVQEGWKVTILEQNGLDNNCSYGNAGMIVPSHFTPLAAPGVIAQGIRWMFNSKSPFYVKPTLSSITWGWKFLQSANQAHVDRSASPLRDLHLASSHLYDDLAKFSGLDFELTKKGILMLYKTQKVADDEAELAHTAQNLGLPVDILNKQQVQALEPHVRLDVTGAAHYKCDGHLNPLKLMGQLIDILLKKGVELFTHHPVSGFEMRNQCISAVIAKGKKFEADKFVMTGGSWLPQLAEKARLKIPVMPGKGYSFMHKVLNNNQQLIHSALLLEARVAVTPMSGQVRFGGTMELAPFNDKINMNRVMGIVQSIPHYLPDFEVEVPAIKDIWHGYRPCSPDGLPYLGKSVKVSNLIIAGGAGMMGLSLGPIFGKVVSELANESSTSVDISIFRPERFN